MSSVTTALPVYPQRADHTKPLDAWFNDTVGYYFVKMHHSRTRYAAFVDAVNAAGIRLQTMSESLLSAEIESVRGHVRRSRHRAESTIMAFAVIRELAARRIGQRHYNVQLIGGRVLMDGMVAEMETGEGKTLTATLAAGSVALAGIPVHIVTVNDYLAERDAEFMRPVYDGLGLRVGLIQQGMNPDERQRQYSRDITYCSNKELAFDYLKDRLALGAVTSKARLQIRALDDSYKLKERLLLRGLQFAIVDEADSVLIDEARTPLIISRETVSQAEDEIYRQAIEFANGMVPGEDFQLPAGSTQAVLSMPGHEKLEVWRERHGDYWGSPRRADELVRRALLALHVYRRDKDYIVQDGKVCIVDEFTGRAMPDRSWEGGLHQMIEVKEGCALSRGKETLSRTSYQRFFRRYVKLAGMTGTAREVTRELWTTYRLPVVKIPPNKPIRRTRYPTQVFAELNDKLAAIVQSVRAMHEAGRPVLIGTASVLASERVSRALQLAGMDHQLLNALHDADEASVISAAGARSAITIATNMAGRGTDIRLADNIGVLGGLHVIATERHEARRIDRQLYGRCGRQGDPGSYQLILALDDELPGRFLARPLVALLTQVYRSETPFARVLCNAALAFAQIAAERHYFRVRRQLAKSEERLDIVLAFSGMRSE